MGTHVSPFYGATNNYPWPADPPAELPVRLFIGRLRWNDFAPLPSGPGGFLGPIGLVVESGTLRFAERDGGGEVGDPGLRAGFPAGGTVVGYADGYGVFLPMGGSLTIEAGVPFIGEGTSEDAWNQQTVVLVAGVFPLDP